jgi:hypothetical protein
VVLLSLLFVTVTGASCGMLVLDGTVDKEEEKEKEFCFEADYILLLIILGNKENMPKIPSAYKPYSTIGLYNTIPHWGTALSTDYYLSFL